MSKTDHTRSAHAYVEEVSGILADLPTPSINAAVMRGAGVRFSTPAEGVPGPQRIILDSLIPGRPLATGMTAAALLARQRGNLAYLEARREQLVREESQAAVAMTHFDPAGWGDHAFEVLDILRAIPLLTGADFSDVFGELADLACVEQHGSAWEVRTIGGEWTGLPLDGLGHGFSFDSLKAQAAANATRLRRWRNALRDGEDGYSGDASLGRSASPAAPRAQRHDEERVEGVLAHDLNTDALKHHKRAISDDSLTERRRRFPELFGGIAFAGASVAASPSAMAERRRRFPELFAGHGPSVDRQASGDGYELG